MTHWTETEAAAQLRIAHGASRQILQVTMAHQQYWEMEFWYWPDDPKQMLRTVNQAVLMILREVPENELWIVQYSDDDEMTEWLATPQDFDWRILTLPQGEMYGDRQWRPLCGDKEE